MTIWVLLPVLTPTPDTPCQNETLQACARALADDVLPPGWERLSTTPFMQTSRSIDEGLYCTLFFRRSPAAKLHDTCRGHPATRVARAAAALSLAGFLTPPVVSHGTLPGGVSYVFSQRIPDGRTIAQLLTDAGCPLAWQTRHRLLFQLGRCIGRLHAAGFLHGNLRLDTVLAQETMNGFQFVFLETQSLSRRRNPSGRAILRELSSMGCRLHSRSSAGAASYAANLSLFEQARIFAAWRQQMRTLNRTEARILAQAIRQRMGESAR